MAFWDTGLTQLKELWGRLTTTQKIVLVGVTALMGAGILALAFWAGNPEYSTLYGNLSAVDAGQVVESLKKDNVPYRLQDGGSTVQVPADRVYDLRLKLASEGVPQGGVVGFEIFDKSGFGMTDFAQKVNYTRALEGELTRTIRRLDGVEGARVHLVLPEKKLFEEESQPATASVVLQLSSGGRLTAKHIQGVVYLVSSSVQGLTPDHVTVVDTRGNVLYQQSGDETAMLAASQIEYKRAYEKDIERRVREMLETVLGSGAAVVQVAAHFDFDKVEETSETYNPDGTAVRSEQRATESSTGASTAQGVPGVASNVGGEAATSGAGGGSSSKETETINYEVSKKVTHVQKSQGSLQRLTVAVAVDGVYKAVQGKKEKEFTPRAADELAKIKSLVEKGVGFDANRGDQVEVTSIPFKPAEGLEEAGGMFGSEFYLALAKYGAALLAALVLVFGVLRPLLRWLAQSREAGGVTGAAGVTGPITVAELEQQMAAAAAGGAVPTPPQEYKLDETTPEETLKRETLKKRITELVRQEPEIAAQLVRSWLAED